eukprot:2717978-Ditylum_brightwellii.AAC.1
MDLPSVGESLIEPTNLESIHQQTNKSSRGQPCLVNVSFALQNSTDNGTLLRLNLPKLTTGQVKDMLHVPSSRSFAHKLLKMITHASQYYKDNWKH